MNGHIEEDTWTAATETKNHLGEINEFEKNLEPECKTLRQMCDQLRLLRQPDYKNIGPWLNAKWQVGFQSCLEATSSALKAQANK